MSALHAIIPAAGSGTRMGPGLKKQFREVGGEAVLTLTLRHLLRYGGFSSFTLVVPADEIGPVKEKILPLITSVETHIVEGGAERQDSVWNGVRFLARKAKDGDLVLIHDGVRPFVTEQVVADVVTAARESGAATCGVPSKDTVKLVDEDGVIARTLDRSKCYLTQTPQAFEIGLLKRAHEQALAADPPLRGTDDAGLVERLGHEVRMTEGLYENIKITTPEDLAIAELIHHKMWR